MLSLSSSLPASTRGLGWFYVSGLGRRRRLPAAAAGKETVATAAPTASATPSLVTTGWGVHPPGGAAPVALTIVDAATVHATGAAPRAKAW